jgi:predicted DNA-binding antitoxin AbrB/MazE fold protein
MTMTISAVYENGVLRPTTAVPLKEGETVEVTLKRPYRKPTPEEIAEAVRGIEAATTIQELAAAALAKPDECDDGYDFLQALNDNRDELERPLFPPELKGITW